MENKEVLNNIHREYEFLQAEAERKKNENIKKAYEKAPLLKEIDEKINNEGMSVMRDILKNPHNADKKRQELEKKLSELKKQREKIMKDFGIDDDYNKPSFKCNLCSDTGYISGKRCKCFEKKLISQNEKSSCLGGMILNDGFENFSLDYYPTQAREIIKEAVCCGEDFVKNFDKVGYNLFFYGTTGLGKTYLSTIIANKLLKKGKSVYYARATKMFTDYDNYKFNDYSLKKVIDEMYNCDLLVIDDLGSENINKNGVAFLFDLINDRLISKKKIIINTNLEISDFTKSYTVRLTSRIYESFRIFRFEGEDIRIKKLMENK